MTGTAIIGAMSRPPLLGGLLALLACLVLPVAVLAVWTDRVVSDTPAYVDTVAPLSGDSDVQEAAADRLVYEASVRLGTTVADDVLRQAALQVVRSDAFPPVWESANREAHRELVRILENRGPGTGTVTIELDGLFAALLNQLDRSGFLASQQGVVDVDPRFEMAETAELEKARSAYSALDEAGTWLPVAWAVIAGLALLVARNRARTAVLLGLGSAVTLLLVLPGLHAARGVLLDRTSNADADLIGAVWDVVTEGLRNGIVLGALAGVALAVLAGAAGALLGRRPTRHVTG